MSAFVRLLSLLVLMACVYPCNGQSEAGKQIGVPQTIEVEDLLVATHSIMDRAEDPSPTEPGPKIEFDVLQTILEGTTNSNSLVARRSYQILAHQQDLFRQIDSAKLAKVIANALNSKDKDLAKYGFKMLDSYNLPVDAKYNLLIGAVTSKDRSIRTEALKRASKSRDDLLPILIARVSDGTSNSYFEEIRMLEHWGAETSGALDALLHRYRLLKKIAMDDSLAKELKRQLDSPEESTTDSMDKIKRLAARKASFNYLHIVYALAEIGPAAMEAMPIALAAANEKNAPNKETYHMAGLLCIQRMLSSRADVDKPARKNLTAVGGLMSSDGGNRVGHLLGGAASNQIGGARDDLLMKHYGHSMRQQRWAVRHLVDRFWRQKASVTRSEVDLAKVERQVDLIFQNHDLLTKTGELTIEEIRNIDPPLLLTDLDNDNNKMISRDELKDYIFDLEKVAIGK